MGVAGKRRPPLPAPTDSSVGAFDRDDEPEAPSPITFSDLETNLTTRTDKTHYSIPEDGSPLVINTDKLRAQSKNLKLREKSKGNQSQSSLLIEYFEGDKEDEHGNRKPSVRVRVTPSSKKKKDEASQDGGARGSVRITERAKGQSTGYSRQIDLGSGDEGVLPLHHRDDDNISSLAGSDLTAAPIELELRGRDRGAGGTSRGISAHEDSEEVEESRLAPINMSEISSMPPDSMLATDLGLDSPTKPVSRRRSRSLEREYELGEEEELERLKPSKQRSRSLSRERLVARKAVEKFERDRKHKEKEREGKPRRSSKSRSASNEYLASTSGKTRRKSSKSYDKEDDASNPSVLTGSNLSGYSAQSGQSASSLSKNPKLLQTVEDAIRRLILPEITALKNEQKGQRRSDRYDDELSSNASSIRSEDRSSSRRVSGGKSGPKLKLNGDTIRSSKGSRRSAGKGSVDSLKRQFEQGASEETIVRDDRTRRRSSKDKTRELAASAAVAGLTAAALRAKDSASSIERRERRKKRSKSHSRSGSRAESRSESRADSVEDVFNKHDVPPMPLVGGLTDSDLTRESILSERTSTPTHERNREVRDLVKDMSNEPSLREASSTPTRQMSPGLDADDGYDDQGYGQSVHLKKEPLGSHLHEDYLHEDLRGEEEEDEEEEAEEEDDYVHDNLHSGYPQDRSYMPMMGMYSGANYSGPTFGYQRRGLSPIQSVSSFEERGEPPPEHMRQQQSLNSISSIDKGLHEEASMDSVSSGTVDNINRKSMRPKSVNLENARETLHGHATPGSTDVGMLGQDIRRLGANAEYIDTPHRAESAVASLMEPSTIGERSNLSYNSNEQSSPNKRYSIETDPHRESLIGQDRNLHTPERSSPLKRELHRDDIEGGSFAHRYLHQQQQQPYGSSGMSPSRGHRGGSASSSPFDANPEMHRSAIPNMGSPMPEIGMYDDDDDLETNPSEIRDDPWEHKEPQQSGSAHDSLRAAANNMLLAAGVVGAGAAVAQHEKALRSQSSDKMDIDSPRHSESPGVREIPDSRSQEVSPRVGRNIDSGYVSGAPMVGPPSDGSITPEAKQPRGLFQSIDVDHGHYAEDPFTTPKRERPTTADSDAMPSPLYDAATGRGMDRIKNQDIVALMDHLTVRDAQRNARDTEILVTLVRSAAEMRNSFEDMKRIMATQEERALDANSRQHTETRKAINGPRAMPGGKSLSSSRAMSAPDVDADDIPSKKRNIFRKALRGLGGGNKQELGNIENMLMQLLDEVAEIKATQQMPQSGSLMPPKTSSGLTSYEQLRDATQLDSQDVYYSTSQQQQQQQQQTRGNGQIDSGFSPSNSSSYRAMQQDRRGSGAAKTMGIHRISTVHEDDEEEDSAETPLDEREQDILGNEEADAMLTPTREFRGVSVATGAPQATNHRQSLSADNTPNKSKRGSSSFFPKISRWSKTTASSVPGLDQTPRQDGQAQFSQQQTPSKSRDQRPVSELSRSASDLNDNYDVRDHYDPLGDDRIRSETSLSNHSASREIRPPSPLIPSTVSEKPTYSAHRDSKDLQHPQPRAAPTPRYQNHLESEARGWISAGADSPSSDVMGNNPVLSRFGGRERGDRHSGVSAGGAQGAGELGTITENESANGGPPRPPKIRDEGPLVPPKVPVDQQSPPNGGNVRTVSFASDRMAQIIGNPQQGRKPSGPRPITRTGSASPAGSSTWDEWKRHHVEVDPNHIPGDDESETF